jgi:hypothetical protein
MTTSRDPLRVLALALFLAAPAVLHPAPWPCNPCAGLLTTDPLTAATGLAADWPLPAESRLDVAWDVELGTAPESLAAQVVAVRRAGATPWVRLRFTVPAPVRDAATALAQELERAAALAQSAMGGALFSVLWTPVTGGDGDPADYAFLLKRAAVTINGATPGALIATRPMPASAEALRALYALDAAAYVDAVALSPGEAPATEAAFAALAELDPGKPVILDALDYPATASQVAVLAARASVSGFASTLFRMDVARSADLAPLKVLAADFAGDLSYDPASNPQGGEEGWAFVRGQDLALRVIASAPSDTSGDWSLRFFDRTIRKISRRDPATGKELGVGGRQAGEAIEVRAANLAPVAVLRIERASPADLGEVEGIKDTVNVTGERGIAVEEILRRLQAFEDAQSRRIAHYEALNTTSLRFLAGGTQSIDATFEGPYFLRTGEPADWAWRDFYINGIKWRGKTLPEIPLIQPEKAAAMPLEILFTKEYRYSLRGSETIEGRKAWMVDFAPLGPAEGKRLYQGTVWVDQELAARLKTKAVQLGLEGDVLSNEETLYYSPVDAGGAPAAWSAKPLVLPLRVVAQQVLSVVNTTTLVEKETRLTSLRINGEDFDRRRSEVLASAVTMVRDTSEGLRYLVKDEAGERHVKEGFDSNKLFLVGGVFYDDSLDFPLPIAGLNYFDFNFRQSKRQLNLFFGGALALLSYADPAVAGTRFDAGADVFGIALAFEDQLFRDGHEASEEAVKSLPARVSLNLGHPLGHFGKLAARYHAEYRFFSRTDTTATDFVLPPDHLTHRLGVDAKYTRNGYQARLGGDLARRSTWEPWGLPGNPEYDPQAKDYTTWRGSLSKTWHLSGFRKLGVEVAYLGGADLDRFSKYGFGFFGDTRVHGFQSDRVRAEEAWLAHATYGLDVGEVLRIDALIDAAWATDEAAGLDRELLAGVGLQGTFLGPWQTIVNLDIGVPVAGPDNGVVAYIAFLKLFK